MNSLIKSIEDEYRRYKALAEGAIAQVPEERLSVSGLGGGNSLAVIVWHVSGNLRSRFIDFLTTDGEKQWRKRDEEFETRSVSRTELLTKWNEGWDVLLATLAALRDEDLIRTITIRGQALAVHEALHRSLAHTSYHVGQIVYLAHAFVGTEWTYLSIPPGGSTAYNADPTKEKAATHADAVRTRP
jgi:uncharacterized protein DUF1572